MHAQNAVHALALFLSYVKDLRTGRDFSRVHADVAKGAHLAVVLNLKYKAKGLAVFLAGNFHVFGLVALYVNALGRSDFIGRGKVVYDRVNQRLHALVVARASHDKGNKGAAYRSLSERGLQLFQRDFLSFQVKLGKRVVARGNRVHQLFAPLVGLVQAAGVNVGLGEFFAFAFSVPADFLHF